MNEDINNFLQSYRSMMATYAPKVPADHPKMAQLRELLGKAEELGASCDAIWTFMEKIQKTDFMNRFSALVSDVATEALKSDRSAGTAKVPAARDVAAAYHSAYDGMSAELRGGPAGRIYERIFEIEAACQGAPEFLARVAEEGLLLKMSTVPLEEQFRPLVAQADHLSLPVMAWHNQQMLDLARRATGVHEIEYESEKLLHLNRMELACDQSLCNELFYITGNAVSSYQLAATEENREAVEYAVRFVLEFYGLSAAQMLALPRVQDLIEHIILPVLRKSSPGASKESFVTEQLRVIEHCTKGKSMPPPDSAKAQAVLWGKSVPLSGWLDEVRHPRRPEV